MKKTLLFLIVITTIACGCKKYKEGPCISFRSAENRIYGNHVLKSIIIDGEEHLNEYLDSLPSYFAYLNVDGSGDVCHIDGIRKDGKYRAMWSSWTLINHNTILKTTTSRGNPPTVNFGPFKTNVLPEWEILRLTKREMKLKTTYENKDYIITLEIHKN